MKVRKLFSTIGMAVVLTLSGVVLAGCGSHLTAQEIDAFGTRQYGGTKKELVQNVALVLKGMGYEVVVADAGKGLVKTARKQVGESTFTHGGASTRERKVGKNGSVSSTHSSSNSRTVGYFRQYTVKITERPDGRCTVRVTPKVFMNETDVSHRDVWNIDGAGGERELWASFFSELESLN